MQDRSRILSGARILILILIWAAGPIGCRGLPLISSTDDWVSAAPEKQWRAPRDLSRNSTSTPQAAGPAPVTGGWRLGDLVELALRCHPATREAWHAAQAAAAGWQSRQADLLPSIDLTAGSAYSEYRSSTGRAVNSHRSHTAAAVLNWVLFDFGGRAATIEEKRQALAAASFGHNSAIQDVVLEVERAFYGYLGAQALGRAYRTSVQEAETNLEAARQRHRAGLATVADVLQAQTALSQARLNYQTAAGRIQTMRGTLAAAVGIAVGSLPPLAEAALDPPLTEAGDTVEEYLRQALQERPELAAQRARVARAHAHADAVAAAMAPRLALDASAGGDMDENHNDPTRNNRIGLTVSVPLFDARSRRNDTVQARQAAAAEQARLEGLESTVALQVWTSYFDLKTAAGRVTTSADLVASAEQLHEVALGRYREGVGAILDLMAARTALESARAQQIQARADWFITMAQLVHHAGRLAAENPVLTAFPGTSQKDKTP